MEAEVTSQNCSLCTFFHKYFQKRWYQTRFRIEINRPGPFSRLMICDHKTCAFVVLWLDSLVVRTVHIFIDPFRMPSMSVYRIIDASNRQHSRWEATKKRSNKNERITHWMMIWLWMLYPIGSLAHGKR